MSKTTKGSPELKRALDALLPQETVRAIQEACTQAIRPAPSIVAPDTGAAASGVMGPVVTPDTYTRCLETLLFRASPYLEGLASNGNEDAGKIAAEIRVLATSERDDEHMEKAWIAWIAEHAADNETPMWRAWCAALDAARSAPAVPTGRESASQDVAHRDTREGLERSATELREQAEADAKRIFGGRSTTRDRE